MSDTKAMSTTNRAILIAAFLLLAGAIGYAIWRDSANNAATPTPAAAASPDAEHA